MPWYDVLLFNVAWGVPLAYDVYPALISPHCSPEYCHSLSSLNQLDRSSRLQRLYAQCIFPPHIYVTAVPQRSLVAATRSIGSLAVFACTHMVMSVPERSESDDSEVRMDEVIARRKPRGGPDLYELSNLSALTLSTMCPFGTSAVSTGYVSAGECPLLSVSDIRRRVVALCAHSSLPPQSCLPAVATLLY